MARYIDDPTAEREIMVMGQPSRRVTARLARPEPAPNMPGVWQYRYQIEGLDTPCEERACGDDSMATIVNSFIGIRRRLNESGLRWCWPDGTEADTGFPRYVPDFGDR